MSIRSRIAALLGVKPYGENPSAALDTLVDDPRRSATRLGASPLIVPWSATRLAGIFEEFERSPSYGSMMEARLARQCLAQFWLMAPVDQLETLYETAIGESYRVLLAGPLPRERLTSEEKSWRSSLAQRLSESFDRPETTNLLLASMCYYAPGQMRVADPLRQVPTWLQVDYARLFDPELFQRIWKPAGLLAPPGQNYGQAPRLGVMAQAAPMVAAGTTAGMVSTTATSATATLPRLARQRGPEALALVQSADYQSRMNGLINLHVIDPGDLDVQQQLNELRRLLGQIWLDAKPEQLEQLYQASSFGRLYRDLVASGFPRLSLGQEEKVLRNQLARLVADMSQPGSVNALMAVLPFYPPGKIAFGGGEQHLPLWLVKEISTIYGPNDPSGGNGATSPAVSGEIPSR